MPVIIYCNGKYYLQIIAKKSWRYIIFAKKGINNDTSNPQLRAYMIQKRK